MAKAKTEAEEKARTALKEAAEADEPDIDRTTGWTVAKPRLKFNGVDYHRGDAIDPDDIPVEKWNRLFELRYVQPVNARVGV